MGDINLEAGALLRLQPPAHIIGVGYGVAGRLFLPVHLSQGVIAILNDTVGDGVSVCIGVEYLHIFAYQLGTLTHQVVLERRPTIIGRGRRVGWRGRKRHAIDIIGRRCLDQSVTCLIQSIAILV